MKSYEFRFIVAAVLLVCLTNACAPALQEPRSQLSTATSEKTLVPASPTLQPTQTLIPTNTPVLACPQFQEEILKSAQANTYGPKAQSEAGFSDKTDALTLITYQVKGNQIVEPFYESIPDYLKKDQNDTASQEKAWQVFTTLIPVEERRMVSQYLAFTDGPGKTLAAVQQTPSDPKKWLIELDIADLANKPQFLFAVLHEYGHLATLNASQVPPDVSVFNKPSNARLYDQQVAACPTYYTNQGCSKPDSYINQFYGRFWSGIIDEWQQVRKPSSEESPDQYDERMFTFYQKYSDQFVDDYAVTNPLEDIAESFASFLLAEQPKGDMIKDQKILFFYGYPKLVQLRSRILSNICSLQ